jgi:cytochrome b561
MALRNTDEVYGSLAKFLHWTIAILIVAQWFLIEAAEEALKGSPERAALKGWHNSVGMLVLLLVVARIVWKLANSGRPVPLGVAWQRKAAAAGHGLLYLLILLQPITGWLIVSTGGRPVEFFGWFTFPAIAAANHDLHELLEDVHEWLFNAMVIVAIVHIAAALYHHLLLKDDTLRRMLPFTGRRG